MPVSDRWCLVSALSDLIQSRIDRSHRLQRVALRAVGAMISSSPPELFSMLFAQQLPSVLCDCLRFCENETNDCESDGTGSASISSMNVVISRRDALQWINCEFGRQYEKTPSNSSPNNIDVENILPSESYLNLTTAAHCIHTLALLLHSVRNSWGEVPFPLELILNGDKMTLGGNDNKESVAAKENYDTDYYTIRGSDKVSLRQRVCKLVEESLLEGNGSKLVCLSLLLLHVFQSKSVDVEHSGGTNSTEIVIIRSALLRIFYHLSVICGNSFFKAIVTTSCVAVVKAMTEFIHDQNLAMSNQKIDLQIDIFSHGLALLTLSNFAKALYISYNNLLFCISAAVTTLSLSDDVRLKSASCSLLHSILSSTLISSHGDGHSITVCMSSSERKYVISMICQGVITNTSVMDSVVDLIAHFASRSELAAMPTTTNSSDGRLATPVLSKEDKEKLQSRAHGPAMWLAGIEFGLRSSGLLDGVLQLIALISQISLEEYVKTQNHTSKRTSSSSADGIASFLSDPVASKIASIVCKTIQSAVSDVYICYVL